MKWNRALLWRILNTFTYDRPPIEPYTFAIECEYIPANVFLVMGQECVPCYGAGMGLVKRCDNFLFFKEIMTDQPTNQLTDS